MKNLHYLISLIDSPNREKCFSMLENNLVRFKAAYGSSNNHQAWVGGYLDHVIETMNIAAALHPVMSKLHPLPFSLSDALLIMFIHDLEKPWRFDKPKIGFDLTEISNLKSKQEKHEFRLAKIKEFKIELSDYQMNAFTYVEGENDQYRSDMRVMNELAAFCHMADVASARIWYNEPQTKGHGY